MNPDIDKEFPSWTDTVRHWMGENDVVLSNQAYRTIIALGNRRATPQASTPAAAEGWQITPKKPNMAMLLAMDGAAQSLGSPLTRSERAYVAALAAAPDSNSIEFGGIKTAAPLPRQAAVQTRPRHIPDSECVQSKCARCTTGCWDVCYMRNPGFTITTTATVAPAAPTVKASQ